jgi:hypothetical protein
MAEMTAEVKNWAVTFYSANYFPAKYLIGKGYCSSYIDEKRGETLDECQIRCTSRPGGCISFSWYDG